MASSTKVNRGKSMKESILEAETVDKGRETLKNLISNLMNAKREENNKKDEEEDEEKKKECSNGGFLDKIISHLPEDAVPTPDEASILIHSVID